MPCSATCHCIASNRWTRGTREEGKQSSALYNYCFFCFGCVLWERFGESDSLLSVEACNAAESSQAFICGFVIPCHVEMNLYFLRNDQNEETDPGCHWCRKYVSQPFTTSDSIETLCLETNNTAFILSLSPSSPHTLAFSLPSCSTTNANAESVSKGASPAVFWRCFQSIIFLPCATSEWVQADANWHPCGPKLLSAILLAALLCQHAPSCFRKVITLTKKKQLKTNKKTKTVMPVEKKKSAENEHSELELT